MGTLTKAERKRRLDIVERTIEQRGWSGRVERGLAEHFGVDKRSVRRYRQEVLDEIAEGYRGIDKDLARGEFLVRLRENMAEAKGAGRYGPVASMLSMEGRVLGVFHEDEPYQQAPKGSLDDVIEQFQSLPPTVKSRLLEALEEEPSE